MTDVREVRTTEREPERERRIFTFKATELIWLFLGVLEALLALRILLKLMAANPSSTFAAWLYSVTDIFLFPFVGLIGTPAVGNMVLELSSFIAMLVYGLAGWAVERLVWVVFYRPRGPSVGITQTTTRDHPSQ